MNITFLIYFSIILDPTSKNSSIPIYYPLVALSKIFYSKLVFLISYNNPLSFFKIPPLSLVISSSET